jgi:glycosyltransferase involved in cell wall biosynthesis
MRRPRVSIGLPVYNAERYVARAITAHLDQTFADFELVISDNGSTDATVEICSRFARQDCRIRLHRVDVNRGLNWNHRRVFELAEADLFRWSAADDLPAPTLLGNALARLERNPELIGVFPAVRNIGADDEPLPTREETLDLLSDDPVQRARSVLVATYQMTFLQGLMRRDALARTSMAWSYVGYDFILLFELALLGKCAREESAVLYRRLHDGQATRALHQRSTVAQFEPAAKTERALPQLRWIFERLRAAMRAPLSAGERARLLMFVSRHTWWLRNLVGRDVARLVRMRLGLSEETPYRL